MGICKQFPPHPREKAELFEFQKRLRKQEAFVDFVRNLRRIFEFCNSGKILTVLLRTQLMFSIQEEKIQQKLLN